MKRVLFIFFIFFQCTNILAIESKIIFRIGNEIITNIDIKNEFKYLSALNKELQNLDKERIFSISRESIIREKIKKIEILNNFEDLNIDKNYLDKILKNIYQGLNLKSEKDFKLYLKNYDLDFKDIEEKIRIDALWNELIIKRYLSKVDVNVEKIKKEIENNKNQTTKSYFLSEIVFEIKDKEELDKKFQLIKNSIDEIGFENTSSTYSIADSAKTGGNIGWINENSLNKMIKSDLALLKKGEISKAILVPGGVLVLKINDIRKEKKEIDLELELKKVIAYQKNKQLSQYSKIYFKKIKKNLDFNE
jgi:peptidyl-prolyl cis-trans isomerase SurA